MPNARRNLKIHEVSLVKSPANTGARVALFKQDKGEDMDDLETLMKSDSATKADLATAMQRRAVEWAKEQGMAVTAEKALADWRGTQEGRKVGAVYRNLRGPSLAPARKVEKAEPSPALVELQKLGERIRKDDPALTPEMAFCEAIRERPDLRERYKKERLG